MANVFNSKFDPVLLPGESAHIITSSEEFDAECIAVGALPELEKDFGALTAATWLTDQEDTNLEFAKLELAQLRVRVLDDVQLRFNNLGPTRQWRTRAANFILKQFPQDPGYEFLAEYLFKASEFFIYQDDTPRFDFYSPVALTECRVLYSGWRFKLRKIGTKGKQTIWVSGWPAGS